MGNDGGIRITKVEDFKQNWQSIKESLKGFYGGDDDLEQFVDNLPDDISELNATQICKLFDYVASCDCPYPLDDTYIITAEGDFVSEDMDFLSMSLPGTSVETWT